MKYIALTICMCYYIIKDIKINQEGMLGGNKMNLKDLKVLVEDSDKVSISEVVKVGRNQIYRDGDVFVVEKYEFTTEKGIDMFSVIDGYSDVELAIRSAKTGIRVHQ